MGLIFCIPIVQRTICTCIHDVYLSTFKQYICTAINSIAYSDTTPKTTDYRGSAAADKTMIWSRRIQSSNQLHSISFVRSLQEEQKLIYSGQLLQDAVVLKDVLRQYDGQETHTVHLVYTPKPQQMSRNSMDSNNTSEAAAAASSSSTSAGTSGNNNNNMSSGDSARVVGSGGDLDENRDGLR